MPSIYTHVKMRMNRSERERESLWYCEWGERKGWLLSVGEKCVCAAQGQPAYSMRLMSSNRVENIDDSSERVREREFSFSAFHEKGKKMRNGRVAIEKLDTTFALLLPFVCFKILCHPWWLTTKGEREREKRGERNFKKEERMCVNCVWKSGHWKKRRRI